MNSRLPALMALLALLGFAGCGRDGAETGVSPEKAAYQKAIDDVNDERKRLMTALVEAQKSGDQEKVRAAAKALADNRVRAANVVRDHSKESKQQ